MIFSTVIQFIFLIGVASPLRFRQLDFLQDLRKLRRLNFENLDKRTNFEHKIKPYGAQKLDMGPLSRILGQAAVSHNEK